MEVNEFLTKTTPLIDAQLREFFPKRPTKKSLEFFLGSAAKNCDLKAIENAVSKPIWDLLQRGGKRWRPTLLLLCCEAVGGNKKKALPFTILPELIHTGTLIVDDVEDCSLLRRGKPCIHIIYGQDIAINAGNLLYFLPLALLYTNTKKMPCNKKRKIYDAYAKAMLALSFGQALDIFWHKGPQPRISEQNYFQMCAFKTGALARLSAEIGAIIGNATQKQISALGNFAESLGVAFQIRDDILNIAPSTKWGKAYGDDISEGKYTLLVVRALKQLNPKEKKRLLEILNMHTKNKKLVKEAILLISKTDAISYAKKKAEQIVKKSWRMLCPCLKPTNAKDQLKKFADYLVEREI